MFARTAAIAAAATALLALTACDKASTTAAAPTASKESAGIGPQSIDNTTVVRQGEGAKREVAANIGQKKTVRVIAPDVIPVPNVQN